MGTTRSSAFSVLHPQPADLDFRRDPTELDVPDYMVVGAHEARGRAVRANEWFDMLAAPSKERGIFQSTCVIRLLIAGSGSALGRMPVAPPERNCKTRRLK